MRRSFTPLVELNLVYREAGKEDVPIHISVSGAYSPPDALADAKVEDSTTWSAIRVKITDENEEGSELPGANPLEALEHALLHIKSFLRTHMRSGRLYDIDGNPFDPDAKSPVFQTRVELENAMKKSGRRKSA